MGCNFSSTTDVASKPNTEKTPSKVPLVTSPETPANVQTSQEEVSKACFGAGCYWGTEKFIFHSFQELNSNGKITKGAVGFMGPESAPANPTYKEVCSGTTGHVEVYDFEYTGGLEYYESLVRFFFQFHDPTTMNRQGNDKGTQYASVVYCYNTEQAAIAAKVRDELQAFIDGGKITCFSEKKVNTDIRNATKFYAAHSEHQDYLTVNPNGYCNHRIRFEKWP